jgi:hypothetical protein
MVANSWIAFAAMGLNSTTASAQVVVVTFNSGVSPVPLPYWLIPLIAILLLLAAYGPLRTRTGIKRGASITLAVVAAALGASMSLPWLREARANGLDVLQLFASPARYSIPPLAMFNMTQSGAGFGFAVENDTGRGVTITGRALEDDPDHSLFFISPPRQSQRPNARPD